MTWLCCTCLCVCIGNCGQYLRGGVGYHQTWHIVWDQRVTSSATASHLQSHQVNARPRCLSHSDALYIMYSVLVFPSAEAGSEVLVLWLSWLVLQEGFYLELAHAHCSVSFFFECNFPARHDSAHLDRSHLLSRLYLLSGGYLVK